MNDFMAASPRATALMNRRGQGRMFWTDEQRLNMLALLLENVGMDAAVRLGDPALWKQAVEDRLKAQQEPGRGGKDAGPE